MKPLYKLHIEGKVLESSELKELKRLTVDKECYWEIFVHVRSNMGKVPGRVRTMDIMDMREAHRMMKRGVSAKIISDKFEVGVGYLRKVLRQMAIENI